MELDEKLKKYINLLVQRYPNLKEIEKDIVDAYIILEKSFKSGCKLLIAGNGGSAADSEHIVGELMKGFKKSRKLHNEERIRLIDANKEYGQILADNMQSSLPAIALDGHFALTTAWINDCDPLLNFAQQVNGYGGIGDVFLGISTSGNSKNIMYAATVAKAKEMKIIGLTGALDSKLSKFADVCVKVPEKETYMIQELHMPIYHCWCLMLEEKFFGE